MKLLILFTTLCFQFLSCYSQIRTPVTYWAFQTQGAIRSAPVADDSNLYFGSADGTLYAVKKSNGILIWKAQTQGPIVGSPCLGGGLVFATSRDNNVYAWNSVSGTLVWRFPMKGLAPYDWHWDYYSAAPVIHGNKLLVGSGDGSLYALNSSTGSLVWKFQTPARIRATPTVYHNLIYQPSHDGNVYVIEPTSGILKWKFATDGAGINSHDFGWDRNSIYAKPAIEDSIMVITSRDGMTYGVNIDRRKEVWRATYGPSWGMSVAADHGIAFVGWSDNSLFSAFEIRSGRELWKFQSGSLVYSQAAVLGDQVIIGSGDRHIYGLDKTSGKKQWEYEVGGPVLASPLCNDNKVFIGSDDGKMVAIVEGTKPRLAVYNPHTDDPMLSALFTADSKLAPYLLARHFESLDSAGLFTFMSDRINDHVPSAIVFAFALIPENMIGVNPEQGLVRRYLNAGGKIVWPGTTPGSVVRDDKGKLSGLNLKPASAMLGVNYVRPDESGNYYCGATQEGLNFGLPPWLTSTFANVDGKNIIPLAYDEFRRPSIWLKKFVDRPGTGFVSVRTWSYNVPVADRDLDLIYRIAVYQLQ